jgi:hypothetical protein
MITTKSIKRMKDHKKYRIDNITYKSLKCLTRLTTIYINGLEIEDDDFGKLTNLRSLELNINVNITGSSIRRLTGLESLRLRGHSFVYNKDIYGLTNLTELYLDDCWGIDGRKVADRLPKLIHYVCDRDD